MAKRKPQPILQPAPPPTSDLILAELGPLDTLVAKLELAWGVGRLPALADGDMLLRFRKARLLLWTAIADRDLIEVQRLAPMMERAWRALVSHALENGHKPLSPLVWEARLDDGRVLAIVRTGAEASVVAKENRHMEVWSMAEVARVLSNQGLVNVVKQEFPGARVVETRYRGDHWAEDFSSSSEFLELQAVEAPEASEVAVEE